MKFWQHALAAGFAAFLLVWASTMMQVATHNRDHCTRTTFVRMLDSTP